MFTVSRRSCLKILGIFIARLLFPSNSDAIDCATGPKRSISEVILDGLEWTIEKDALGERSLSIGSTISFVPAFKLIVAEERNNKGIGTRNVFQNIYEIGFRPLKRFVNNLDPHRYHYILQVAPDIYLFHFNWLYDYECYLQLGKTYWGRGFLGVSAGDPADHNPFIPKSWTKRITKKGVIRQIQIAYDDRDYFENQCPWKEGEVYTGDSHLVNLGYPHQYQKFKQHIRNIQTFERDIESTDFKGTFENLKFRVELI